MTIIRKLRISDKNKVKDMISFLGNDEAEKFVKKLLSTSCDIFHYWLPLRLKFLAESYVLVDNNDCELLYFKPDGTTVLIVTGMVCFMCTDVKSVIFPRGE